MTTPSHSALWIHESVSHHSPGEESDRQWQRLSVIDSSRRMNPQNGFLWLLPSGSRRSSVRLPPKGCVGSAALLPLNTNNTNTSYFWRMYSLVCHVIQSGITVISPTVIDLNGVEGMRETSVHQYDKLLSWNGINTFNQNSFNRKGIL